MEIRHYRFIGQARFPDGSGVSFGDRIYDTPGCRGDSPALRLKGAAVFGPVEVEAASGGPKPDTVPGQDVSPPASPWAAGRATRCVS